MVANTLNGALGFIGDKTTEITGIESAASRIPKYQGVTYNRKHIACYDQINGQPNPKEFPKYTEKFVEVRESYETLSDTNKKAEYDIIYQSIYLRQEPQQILIRKQEKQKQEEKDRKTIIYRPALLLGSA